MKFNGLYRAALIAFTVSGCGSDLERKPHGLVSSGLNNQDATSGRCVLSDEALKSGYTLLDINKLTVYTKDNKKASLCDAIKDNGWESAVVQLAGVFCLSCQDEAKYFTDEFVKNKVYPRVGHVVVMTDDQSEYTEEDFKMFFEEFAPHSLRMHDKNISLWKELSKDPQLPVRPTMVSVNLKGVAYLVNEEEADVSQLFKIADELADQSASLDQSPKPSPAPQPKTSPKPSPTPAPIDDQINGDQDSAKKPDHKLTPAQNFAIYDSRGIRRDLISYYDSDYLMIDLSQYYCSYCKKLADKHQQDIEYQSLMNNGKCKSLTAIPRNDLSTWLTAYPLSTFVGQTTRSVDNLAAIAAAYKEVNFRGTPTAFIIDRSGKVLAQATGRTPPEYKSICKL